MPQSTPLKQELFSRVPAPFHSQPSFLTLIELIQQQELQSKEHLHHFLEQSVSSLEKQVNRSKNAAFQAKILKDQIQQLEALKKCQELTRRFLV
ncbi:MAG: hypothetical protein AABX04_02620 [Nanoarchaeota archaeon]